MGLDYSKGCVNFRDVGECLSLIAGEEMLPARRLLRGGKVDFVITPEQMGNPGSIINLRKGPDPEAQRFGADYWHFAISNEHEKYDTTDPLVRRWLNEVMQCLTTKVQRWPVLLHCTSGKDRTGVAVAALLCILGIEREWIIQEYLWSEGEVKRTWIERSLDGIDDPADYFHRVDIAMLRTKIIGESPFQIGSGD